MSTMSPFKAAALGCAAIVVVLVAACDSGPSAVPARDRSNAAMDAAAAAARANQDRVSAPAGTAEDETPSFNGRPLWSANRKYTAQQNADYHFKRNGAEFGAADVEQFVQKAHAFVNQPPRGALTLKRANGDTLIYDPKDNVFAVSTKDGAPRTMFKPDDGMAYWERQKERETQSASSGRSRRSDDG